MSSNYLKKIFVCILISSLGIKIAYSHALVFSADQELNISKSQLSEIELWFKSEVDYSPELKKLVLKAIKNRILTIVAKKNFGEGGFAKYVTSEHAIYIKAPVNSETQQYDPEKFYDPIIKSYLLSAIIFEIGNSLNESFSQLSYQQFSDGLSFAKAMQKAEATTFDIVKPAVQYGIDNRKWDPEIFWTEAPKNWLTEEAESSHRDFYVKQWQQASQNSLSNLNK